MTAAASSPACPRPFAATRYHSLCVAPAEPARLPDRQRAAPSDGTVQGFRHASLPIHGVQFHPESIASEHGHVLLGEFPRACARRVGRRHAAA